ncbi:O-antigen polysaccharide polymerase Wzy [Lactobacillus delbrueckii]|uniref:O-antigen polysaccharide polymerase Wzy n=1 Tax=Lactobacillus delbrueckii TaxID=1584 RepID=UPI00206F4707|nr:O-antigen polysaccharide polymerase Wzy [Lactobacillus delbrueckii]UPS60000.1 O-antigen polysaccharide polymerase Wzy [Lactobacillus delbrueckii subsp. bulgaricus]
MSKYLLILNLSLLFWSMFTMFSSREDDLLKTYSFEALEKNNSRQFINFACLVAIACSIIEFPRLPFTSVSSAARFATLLPGTGWNHLALIAMLFLLPSLKHSKQVKWTYIFVIFWFLSHGERVDMIGFLILLLFLYLKNHKITISTLIKSIVVALIIFLVFSYIGERRGGADNITLGSLFEKLFKQNTASDVGYVFNISCDYIKKYPLTHGKLLIFYLEQIIPDLAIPSVQNCGDIFLGARYAYPGGAYILTEPLLDFGVLGVLIIPNVYLGLIYMFLKNKRQYKFYVYIFLGATVLRYVWYGMEYIETALVWFIPFFYYLYHKRVKVKFS